MEQWYVIQQNDTLGHPVSVFDRRNIRHFEVNGIVSCRCTVLHLVLFNRSILMASLFYMFTLDFLFSVGKRK